MHFVFLIKNELLIKIKIVFAKILKIEHKYERVSCVVATLLWIVVIVVADDAIFGGQLLCTAV